MGQGDFVMADDRVVKVGNVQCAIGAELYIDRAKPAIFTTDEVWLRIDSRG